MSVSNEASDPAVRRFGSYTTAKVTGGRVERLERHVARLRRDAARLGLPLPERAAVEEAFLEAAREAFGRGDGIVRVEWSHAPGEAPQLIAKPRAYVAAPPTWRAITSSIVHPGPELRANTKCVDVAAWDAGREAVAAGDFEEVLLFDAQGRLVEGSHSNFLLVLDDGRLVTPALALGGVEGLGLETVRYGRGDLEEAELSRDDVASARELMSVNVVRGVVPIVSLDGQPVGDGRPGPRSVALGAVFGVRWPNSTPR